MLPATSGASVMSRIGAMVLSSVISGNDTGRVKSGWAPSLPALI